MSVSHEFRKELQFEAAYTRKLLSVIPTEAMDLRPVAKGFSIKELAIHVADLMNWVKLVTQDDRMNFGALKSEPPPYDTAEKLVVFFDESLNKALGYLKDYPDANWQQPWSITRNGEPVMTRPRQMAMRRTVLNHWYHHRGELSFMLRNAGVAVPTLFGPNAVAVDTKN